MNLSSFFIDRPIFSAVLSILIVLVGALAYIGLPIAQYPDVTPPTINVSAAYPGASAKTVSETVATPLEQEINGVEGMMYMQSSSTADGTMTLTVTFEPGTDIDSAQVLVQNRVARAEPTLPEIVRRTGVTTQKASSSFLLVVHLISPNETYDRLYISNYARLQLLDELTRVQGVGRIQVFGEREYSMRIWINPERAAELDLTADEIVAALRGQNVQVASGTLNQAPIASDNPFQLSVQLQGRLTDPAQFDSIIVKTNGDGSLVRLRDIGRVELGAQDYSTNAYLDNGEAVAIPFYAQPGANAIETASGIEARLEELSANFPDDFEYRIAYNPTRFIEQSVAGVYQTLAISSGLVVLVIFIFLQSLRAAAIPVIAIPIAIIGTFALMSVFGFSLNNLSLFGLVLAIGIVVDDAIVVVENVERNLADGQEPREAAVTTMKEVGTALVATTLVLAAVFIPTTFIPGLTGAFYRQFALTITAATIISTIVSLTLSPALARLFLKPPDEDKDKKSFFSTLLKPFDWFFSIFNSAFDKMESGYTALVKKLVRMGMIVMVVYAGLLGAAWWGFNAAPTGFVPDQDQSYVITAIQLPPGSSLARTDEVIRRVADIGLGIEGVEHAVQFAGFNGATFSRASNAGAIFFTLGPFDEREGYKVIQQKLQSALRQQVGEAFVLVIVPPPIQGIGNGSGFNMMVQDRGGLGLEALNAATQELMAAANEDPSITNAITFFEVSTPEIFLDINRDKAELMGVPVESVFAALETYLGSSYINDFNYLGRTYRVTAQADAPYRKTIDDVSRYYARNVAGEMVPVETVAKAETRTGSQRVVRYNLYNAASLTGEPAEGVSSGAVLTRMEALAEEILPDGMSYEWTDLSYQQKQAGNTGMIAFGLAVLMVFLFLAAQFESLSVPLSIILIVPMGLLFAILGVLTVGQANNILTQIGLVVLVALACKNAILIVEFAVQKREEGMDRFEAAVTAAKLRFRPILMTALSFILGTIPLLVASGAGSEMRNALGVAVFSGMLGVTIFGLFLTPVFYVLATKFSPEPKKNDENGENEKDNEKEKQVATDSEAKA